MEGYPYTKKGEPDLRNSASLGIIPRAITELYDRIGYAEEKSDLAYTVYVSYLQLYQEKIFDLLNPAFSKKESLQGPGLKLRWNKLDVFTVENLYNFECRTPDELMYFYQQGIQNKVVASHNLNHASSRSHCIFTITVEQTDANRPDNTIISKLQLVDLAGSERQKDTGTSDKMAKESIDINKSLFNL